MDPSRVSDKNKTTRNMKYTINIGHGGNINERSANSLKDAKEIAKWMANYYNSSGHIYCRSTNVKLWDYDTTGKKQWYKVS